MVDGVFSRMVIGRMTMTYPDGRVVSYGRGGPGTQCRISVRNADFFRKCVLFGDVGFGESYVDGDWQTDNITDVIRWMIENVEHHPTLMADVKKSSPVNWLKSLNALSHIFNRNSRSGSRKNISAHYDLSNEFFALFLDPTMTYSSAYFKRAGQDLHEAQIQKYEELCCRLRLKSSDHLLEIGSGWGGMAIYAAKNFGCRVTTVTISRKQFDLARQRITQEGLAGRVDILLQDYRDLDGVYDKIVSIEMLEAVGDEFYETYFTQCHRLLKPEGLLGLQVILSPDHRYESFRKNIDFIQKHIFPGSLLPSLARLHQAVNRTGALNLFHYEDISLHYARTLNMWREQFRKNIGAVKRLGMDDAFVRKWDYYLSYCEAAFATRNIFVAQMTWARPNVIL